jgi:hypothetical protein
VVNQRLRFFLDFQYKFKGPSEGPWMGSGLAVVEDQKPVAVDSNNLLEVQSLAHEPDWKIITIEFQRLNNMAKMMEQMKKHR